MCWRPVVLTSCRTTRRLPSRTVNVETGLEEIAGVVPRDRAQTGAQARVARPLRAADEQMHRTVAVGPQWITGTRPEEKTARTPGTVVRRPTEETPPAVGVHLIEPFAPVYSAPGRDLAADGRDHAG